MRKYLGLVITLLMSANAFANSLTVRDIKLLGDNQIEIQLDGSAPKSAFEVDYVRDIVQFSIQNATIYPAKILHSDSKNEAFSKVFAYQYAPSLVRVRFSVEGRADQFQGKVKWEQNGKNLVIRFPAGMIAKKDTSGEDTHERSLLAKVLGRKDEVKVEKIEDKDVKNDVKIKDLKADAKFESAKADAMKAEAAKLEIAKADAAKAETAKADAASAEAAVKAESAKAETVKTDTKLIDSESLPVLTKTKKESKLGGARPGASPLRAFLSMLLVVGGLGAVLLYVKKKKNTVQAKKVGDSWISNLLGGQKKSKTLIEVVAVHALGPKQSITVVRIKGQQMVLGVTEGNVQLITQLDSDDEIDVLDDPNVADSIGKIFGGKPSVEKTGPMMNFGAAIQAAVSKPARSSAATPSKTNSSTTASDTSFSNLLKNSSGAGAIVARNAYQSQQSGPQAQYGAQASSQYGGQPVVQPTQGQVRNVSRQAPTTHAAASVSPLNSSVRDQIKQRLAQQGSRS